MAIGDYGVETTLLELLSDGQSVTITDKLSLVGEPQHGRIEIHFRGEKCGERLLGEGGLSEALGEIANIQSGHEMLAEVTDIGDSRAFAQNHIAVRVYHGEEIWETREYWPIETEGDRRPLVTPAGIEAFLNGWRETAQAEMLPWRVSGEVAALLTVK
jgi:hypothetical protein